MTTGPPFIETGLISSSVAAGIKKDLLDISESKGIDLHHQKGFKIKIVQGGRTNAYITNGNVNLYVAVCIMGIDRY